ncbi:MAG: hypothetical protein Q4E47_00065 [Candidatus Saccharibacteria bacterium]|nr:hypothetical protein [Candidatus Saccharibacteria bacterium]
MSIAKLSYTKLRDEIVSEASSINIPPGTAEIIAKEVIGTLKKWTRERSMITDDDLSDFLVKELKKYNKDLAYLFKQKEKLI